MTEERKVDIQIDQTRQYGHPVGADHLSTRRHLKGIGSPDRRDPLAVDQNHAVGDSRTARAVDQRATDERLLRSAR